MALARKAESLERESREKAAEGMSTQADKCHYHLYLFRGGWVRPDELMGNRLARWDTKRTERRTRQGRKKEAQAWSKSDTQGLCRKESRNGHKSCSAPGSERSATAAQMSLLWLLCSCFHCRQPLPPLSPPHNQFREDMGFGATTWVPASPQCKGLMGRLLGTSSIRAEVTIPRQHFLPSILHVNPTHGLLCSS